MNAPQDSTELTAMDRLVVASLSAPLSAETEARLRSRLERLREQLRNPQARASAAPDHSPTTARVTLLLCLLLGAVATWTVWPRGPGRATPNPNTNSNPVPAQVSPATRTSPPINRPVESLGGDRTPIDSAPSAVPEDTTPATILPDDEGYGTLTGQFVLSDPAPVLPPLVKGTTALQGFPAKCNPNIPDESLLVDRATNGIENIVVYLRKPPATVHPALVTQQHSPLTFDATCGRFTPHVLFVRTNQPVRCRSLDPLRYNIHTLPLRNTQANDIIGPTPTPVTITAKLAERLPTKVVDDIHPWMSAYWLTLDHPYAAITVKDGRFAIRQLPAGTHEFQVWHERAGYVNKSLQVTIASQQQTDLGVMPVNLTQLMR